MGLVYHIADKLGNMPVNLSDIIGHIMDSFQSSRPKGRGDIPLESVTGSTPADKDQL